MHMILISVIIEQLVSRQVQGCWGTEVCKDWRQLPVWSYCENRCSLWNHPACLMISAVITYC